MEKLKPYINRYNNYNRKLSSEFLQFEN